MSGFFLMRRDVFDEIAPSLTNEGFKILLDIIVSAGRARARRGKELRIGEVPYTFRPRHAGESKMSSLVVVQFLGLVLSKLTGGLLPAELPAVRPRRRPRRRRPHGRRSGSRMSASACEFVWAQVIGHHRRHDLQLRPQQRADLRQQEAARLALFHRPVQLLRRLLHRRPGQRVGGELDLRL